MVDQSRPQIVYILPNYDPHIGSHFFHVYELIQAASRDLDIFLVIERAASLPTDKDIPCYVQRFQSSLLRFFELGFILLRERFHGRRYFYTHYSFFGGVASWLVVRMFGGTAYYWNCGMPWLYRRGKIEEAVFRFVLRHTIFVTGTPGLRDEYCRHYGLNPVRTRILPNWIHLDRFRQGMDRARARGELGVGDGVKVILFVHHLSPRKGAHILPKIMREVLEREKRAMFLIVGDGPEYESLKLQVQSLKFTANVRLIGEVAHQEIPKYFWAADVFLMPSEEEGFPHVLLEAMAVGIPYAASDVGGVREITPPVLQEYLVRNGEPHAFGEKIIALLGVWEETRREFARQEHDWVRGYDLRRVVPVFVSLYR